MRRLCIGCAGSGEKICANDRDESPRPGERAQPQTEIDISAHRGLAVHNFAACVDYQTVDVLQSMLDSGASPDAKDFSGWPAVVIAAMNGDAGIIDALHEFGADLEATEPGGNTAMNWAACEDHLECVQLLLRLRADPTVRNQAGRTPLQAARYGQCHGVVAFLRADNPIADQVCSQTYPVVVSILGSRTDTVTASPPGGGTRYGSSRRR